MTSLSMRVSVTVLACLAALVACAGPADDEAGDAAADAQGDASDPTDTGTDSPDAKGPLSFTAPLPHANPVQVDFLWVLDHSSSMAHEQKALARDFGLFLQNIETLGPIDARMAVTSIQQISDLGGPTVATNMVKQVGQFLHAPAKSLPPNATEKLRAPCSKPGDCAKDPISFTFAKTGPATLCPADGLGMTPNPLASVAPAARWRCDTTATTALLTNLNCSINASCQLHCQSDAECRAWYEPDVPPAEQRAICYIPGGTTPELARCMFPPDTADCPAAADLPAVLANDQRALFKCLAIPGAGVSSESKFEGGLRAAWYALDPQGINCPHDAEGKPAPDCQHAQLLRDDAWLVLVFVSNDDDCSVDLQIPLTNLTADDKKAIVGAAGKPGLLPMEVQDRCQQFGDAVGGDQALNDGHCEFLKLSDPTLHCLSDCVGLALGSEAHAACVALADQTAAAHKRVDARFAPVATFVDLYRTLKADPERVLVAAISGDSAYVGATEAETAWHRRMDRAQQALAGFKNMAPKQAPYVCAGKLGEADYGSRYFALVDAFGPNGAKASLCGDDLKPALERTADLVLRHTSHVCLPKAPEWDAAHTVPQLEVQRVRGGQKTVLAYVGNQKSSAPGWFLRPAPECGETSAALAIAFTEPGQAGDAIEVTYP